LLIPDSWLMGPHMKVAALSYHEDVDQLHAEEHALVASAQRGDRPAFAVLVERYWERLYRWLYHLTHNRHAAEDLAQETFLKAFAGLASFRTGSHFQAWLFRIAYNGFVNQRRLTRRVRQFLPADLPARDAEPAEQAMSREALC